MYTTHFGLHELPFTLTPNTQFVFSHAAYQEALNTLLVATRSGEGFMKLVGEVGTGKTLLCRTFLNRLEKGKYKTAYIPNPYVGPNTLLLGVADELGIKYPERVNQHQILKALTRYLVDTYAEGRRVVLCLDEAQAMPVETLEALRLLTNLETERRKLMQVILFGQPELNDRLNESRIRQLKQRITFSHNLSPMLFEDMEYYIAHRLNKAGYEGTRLFDHAALKRIHKASMGVPRLVNILAHKALLAAYGEGAQLVTGEHVVLAIKDTESIQRGFSRFKTRMRRVVGALFGMTFVSIGILYWGSWL